MGVNLLTIFLAVLSSLPLNASPATNCGPSQVRALKDTFPGSDLEKIRKILSASPEGHYITNDYTNPKTIFTASATVSSINCN